MACYQLIMNFVAELSRCLDCTASRKLGKGRADTERPHSASEELPLDYLPAEIRIMIWRASVPDFAPCTFTLSSYTGTLCIMPTPVTQHRISAIRSLLLINRESRAEIEKLYPQVLPLKSYLKKGAMRWDSATDIFVADPLQRLHFLQSSSTTDFVRWSFDQDWNQKVWNFGCHGERLKEIHRVPMTHFGPYPRVIRCRNDYSLRMELSGEGPLRPSTSADANERAFVARRNAKISQSWARFLVHIAAFPNLRSFLIILPNCFPVRDWLQRGASWGDVQMLSHTLCIMPGLFAWNPVPEQRLRRYPPGNSVSGVFASNFEWFYEEIRSRLRFFCSITERGDLRSRGRSAARSIRNDVPPVQLQKLVALPIYIMVETDHDLSDLMDDWVTKARRDTKYEAQPNTEAELLEPEHRMKNWQVRKGAGLEALTTRLTQERYLWEGTKGFKSAFA